MNTHEMKYFILLIFLFSSILSMTAQEKDLTDFSSDKVAVKAIVERFLTAAGNYDLDAMPSLFSQNANINQK